MTETATTASSSPIYMVTVSAPTNIAVIKYWGKANVQYNTPINSSLSVTLDQSDLRAVTTAATSKSFQHDRLWLNGEEILDVNESKRFRACVDGVLSMVTEDYVDETDGTTILISKEEWKQMKFHISSYNTFPTAAGLASSAAGYAALVTALAQLLKVKEEFIGQLSTLARQGSGSACRSMYGGFVAWRMGTSHNHWMDSKAEQIATEHHWPEIRALILVVSAQKKDTSSTEGMETSVLTSTLLQHRATQIVPERMSIMESAWLNHDFQTFGKLTMQDSNQFHATCLDTYPPIFYMNDISRSIIRLITTYNTWAGTIRAAYTFDAGPNAVLYLLESHVVEVTALMMHYFPSTTTTTTNDNNNYINNKDIQEQVANYVLDPTLLQACNETGRIPQPDQVQKLYLTKAGPGPQILSNTESNLDPMTGLNIYKVI